MGFQNAINKSVGILAGGLGIGSQINKLNLKARNEAAMDRMRELQIAKLEQSVSLAKIKGEAEANILDKRLLQQKEALKQARAKTRIERAKARQEISKIKEGGQGGE